MSFAAWLPTAHKMRLLGVMMLGVCAACMYQFVKTPTGGIPGYPQAWRGGPLILGASFFGISGGFLLIQRRFSLAALIVAGLISATLTSAIHAYVRSIREVATLNSFVNVPPEKLTEFIARSRELTTPERVRQFADDENRKGWLRSGVDFETAWITYGAVPGHKDSVDVTINIEFCPYIHPIAGDARKDLLAYSIFLHSWIIGKQTGRRIRADEISMGVFFPPPFSYSAPYLSNHFENLLDVLVDSTHVLNSIGNTNYYAVRDQARHEALVWLAGREPDPELKKFFEDALSEYDKQARAAGK